MAGGWKLDVEGLVMIGLVTIGLSDVFETLQQQKCIEDLTRSLVKSIWPQENIGIFVLESEDFMKGQGWTM